MSDDRRKRLENVLQPLIELDQFSPDTAKRVCSESKPAYVTRTIKQLVSSGLLQIVIADEKEHFRWTSKEREDDSQRWIEQQIHGVQIKETPKQDRPRERLMRDGAATLTNADLLAILIRVGVPKESAVVGAQKIANRYAERLGELPKCSARELKEISPAATASSFAQIMAGIELGRRIAEAEFRQQPPEIKITSTKQAIDYCSKQFARLAMDGVQEEFHIVTLDTKHKPIRTHRITVGTLDASLVHPREVFRPAIQDAASAVILVHNHPSGDPTPSREDHQVTNQLTDAGKLIGIQVLDHIVVARMNSISIRECT